MAHRPADPLQPWPTAVVSSGLAGVEDGKLGDLDGDGVVDVAIASDAGARVHIAFGGGLLPGRSCNMSSMLLLFLSCIGLVGMVDGIWMAWSTMTMAAGFLPFLIGTVALGAVAIVLAIEKAARDFIARGAASLPR